MGLSDLIKELETGAELHNGCSSGMDQLKTASSITELIKCYYDRIDYCLANDFPSNKLLLMYKEALQENGVFIDAKETVKNNQEKFVLLGNSHCNLKIDEWTVSRGFVKHKSKLVINVSGDSVVMIDALDNSEIFVSQSGNARVIVNLYARAKCHIVAGNARVVDKKMFTYEI